MQKVYLLERADKILLIYAHALLKTFEEKPDHAVILFVTDIIKGIIEMILSRLKKIYAPNTKEEPILRFEALVEKALKFKLDNDLYACLDILPELEEAPL